MAAEGGITAKLIDYATKSDKGMLIVAICSGLLLVLPLSWQTALHLQNWRPALWLVLFVSTVAFLVGVVYDQTTKDRGFLARSRVKRRLCRLATDEKDVLKRFVDADKATLIFSPAHGGVTAHSLIPEGILREALPTGQLVRGFQSYTIEPWILRYLKLHPTLVEPQRR